jgi:hypothetical protein
MRQSRDSFASASVERATLPRTETWEITDDHRGISPHYGQAFVALLEKHESLAVEFGCARYDSTVLTYNVHGLRAAIASAGLTFIASPKAAPAADPVVTYCKANPTGFYGEPGGKNGVDCKDRVYQQCLKDYAVHPWLVPGTQEIHAEDACGRP